jgi:hypothetical protein
MNFEALEWVEVGQNAYQLVEMGKSSGETSQDEVLKPQIPHSVLKTSTIISPSQRMEQWKNSFFSSPSHNELIERTFSLREHLLYEKGKLSSNKFSLRLSEEE